MTVDENEAGQYTGANFSSEKALQLAKAWTSHDELDNYILICPSLFTTTFQYGWESAGISISIITSS